MVTSIGDYPEPVAFSGPVGRQNAATICDGSIIGLPILGADIPPVTCFVATKELGRRLTCLLKDEAGAGRDVDTADAESSDRFHRRHRIMMDRPRSPSSARSVPSAERSGPIVSRWMRMASMSGLISVRTFWKSSGSASGAAWTMKGCLPP